MIPCLFLIRSPCLRCIVREMLNSPNDQVWPTRCLGFVFFFALHDFALACPFVPRFELCGYACFASLRIFFFDYAYWKMLVSHVVFLDEKWYTSIYRLFIMSANWQEGNGYWIHLHYSPWLGPSCWLPNPYYKSFGGGKVYYGMSLVRPIPPWNGPSSLVGWSVVPIGGNGF